MAALLGVAWYGYKLPPPSPLPAFPRELYAALSAWAAENDGAFPNEPGDANANFRLLFKAGLLSGEEGFGGPGDGWCLAGKPDGVIGSAPDFAKALEPGELSIIYVAGHDASSNSQSVLMIAGIGPVQAGLSSPEATASSRGRRGRVVLLTVNGSAKTWDPPGGDKTRNRPGSHELDWLVEDLGIDPKNLRLPARIPKP